MKVSRGARIKTRGAAKSVNTAKTESQQKTLTMIMITGKESHMCMIGAATQMGILFVDRDVQ
jgi:hypothetical protein